MEENKNTQDPFVSAMQGTQPVTTEQHSNEGAPTSPVQEKYPVNPNAEKVVDVIAEITKYLGIFVGLLCFFIGLIYSFGKDSGGGALIVIGLSIAFSGIVSWAFFKLIVNISRNLFLLNERVKKLEEK